MAAHSRLTQPQACTPRMPGLMLLDGVACALPVCGVPPLASLSPAPLRISLPLPLPPAPWMHMPTEKCDILARFPSPELGFTPAR